MRRLTLAAMLIISTVSVASVAQTFKITMTHMPQGQQIGIVARASSVTVLARTPQVMCKSASRPFIPMKVSL
jgi:hypothetical protein